MKTTWITALVFLLIAASVALAQEEFTMAPQGPLLLRGYFTSQHNNDVLGTPSVSQAMRNMEYDFRQEPAYKELRFATISYTVVAGLSLSAYAAYAGSKRTDPSLFWLGVSSYAQSNALAMAWSFIKINNSEENEEVHVEKVLQTTSLKLVGLSLTAIPTISILSMFSSVFDGALKPMMNGVLVSSIGHGLVNSYLWFNSKNRGPIQSDTPRREIFTDPYTNGIGVRFYFN